MSGELAAELRTYIVELFSDALAATGVAPNAIDDRFDLLLEGVIDSLGVLELITAVEKRVGFELDLSDLPAEDLTKIGPFCAYVESLAARRT
jgi:acyl carrier protein